MAQQADRPIEYEQPPVATAYAIRRGFRLLILFTLINTVLLALNVGNGAGFQFLQKQWSQWRQARLADRQRQQRAAQQRQLEQKWIAIQQQCVAYAAPAGQVVYDENPARGLELLAKPDGGYERLPGPTTPGRATAASAPPPRWQSPARAKLPAAYVAGVQEVFGYAPALPSISATRGGGNRQTFAPLDGAMLFMHGRTAPDVGSRLVIVRLATSHLFADSPPSRPRARSTTPSTSSSLPSDGTPAPASAEPVHVYSLAIERVLVADAWTLGVAGSWRPDVQTSYLPLLLPDTTRREVLRVSEPVAEADIPPIAPGNETRFFAGQADPRDESHFTIDYELDGRPGTIDGYLRGAGVVLTPRTGQSVFIGRQNAWDLVPSAENPVAPDKSGR